jgi:group I intron endonuclease
MRSHKTTGSIYLVENLKNGKKYVGKTIAVNVRYRWDQHVYLARHGYDLPLSRAIRKHGLDAFAISVLWVGPVQELSAMERRFIVEKNSRIPLGYNCTEGGEGVEQTKEIRAKISAAQKGISRKKNTPEEKYRKSEGQRRRWASYDSEERKERASSNRGQKRAETTIEKLRDTSKALWADPSIRAKMIESLCAGSQRRWSNPQERERQREQTKMRWQDPEFRRKFSEARARGKERRLNERIANANRIAASEDNGRRACAG